jgi:hypothetical protein
VWGGRRNQDNFFRCRRHVRMDKMMTMAWVRAFKFGFVFQLCCLLPV